MEEIDAGIAQALYLKYAEIVSFRISEPRFHLPKRPSEAKQIADIAGGYDQVLGRIVKCIRRARDAMALKQPEEATQIADIADRYTAFIGRIVNRVKRAQDAATPAQGNSDLISTIRADFESTFAPADLALFSAKVGPHLERFREALTFILSSRPLIACECCCPQGIRKQQLMREFCWLGEMYAFCKRVVMKHYSNLLNDLHVGDRSYCFHTALNGGIRPHGLLHPTGASGKTLYPRGNPTEIYIYVPTALDTISYLTLPAIIFHEAICHAHQRAGASDNKPRERPAYCRFGEGWMDRVALEILNIALSEAPHDVPADLQMAASAIKTEAQNLHDSRIQTGGADGWEERQLGAFACRDARRAIEYHPEAFGSSHSENWAKESREIFFQFSFLLNLTGGHAQVYEIIDEITRLLPLRRRSKVTSAFAAAVSELRETRKLTNFIINIKAVSTSIG